jgi:hypothetical protein
VHRLGADDVFSRHILQVQPDDLTLRQMDAAQLQHRLFPLHPVTLEEFKSNARFPASSNSEENQKLLWRVMAEDFTEDQVQCRITLAMPIVQ